MTIETKFRVDRPSDGNRYVRYDGSGSYFWCETGQVTRAGWRYDIAQGTCAVDDLPPGVAMKAIAAHGSFPSYVDWPL